MENLELKGKKVLVAGAGGFVGGFIVEEGLRRGCEVWAGVRASTSRVYLTDPRIHFAELDFTSPASLADSLGKYAPEGGWDYIVYNLGLTKALRFSDFNRVNHDLLRMFTEAIKELALVPRKFLYMSSLSVMGPGEPGSYAEFTEDMIPFPDTKYGASKLKAEMLLVSSGLDYIILRPTGVYGPRDNDYYLMYKSIGSGFDFSVGFKRQSLTFIYVTDLAKAVFDALEKAPCGNVYFISEKRSYSQKEYRRIVLDALGRGFALPVRVPLWGLKVVSVIAEKIGALRGKPSTLNRDKYHIMRQRNWNVSTRKAERDFGFKALVSLREGVKESVDWNKAHHRL